MINTLPQSLIEAAKKVLVESTSPRLHHIADVKTNFPDADYYVIRKGTPDTVGKITKEFSPEHIGVKINRTDVMDPRYHQYAMQYAHMNGYWKPKAKGALRLQHISVDDVKNMPALYQGLNESAEHPMIDVDGEMKHRHNSDGIPIHHTDEGIRNFHRWFGNSKVVDKNGRPLVVYHGTRTSFDTFEHGKGKITDTGVSGKGFYFTPKADYADAYGRDEHGANIMPVYLKLENPFIHKGSKTEELFTKFAGKRPNDYWNTDWSEKVTNGLKSIGHDGYMDSDYDLKNNGLEFVAFHSSQIKSTIGNSGTFSHPTRITEDAEHPMIDVDGEMKHRHNSDGMPIHHTDEGIRNFHRWFGNSSVVDEHGRPLVVYHGSQHSKITEFNPKHIGSRYGYDTAGFFFTDDKRTARGYAYSEEQQSDIAKRLSPEGKSDAESRITHAYLSIKNPITTKKIAEHKDFYRAEYHDPIDLYDSNRGPIEDIIHLHDGVHLKKAGTQLFVVKHPQQIKSAIGNNGDFHPDKPQINESTEEEPQIHTNNSLGMPIHRTVEGIHNFNKWFEGSQVKDEHGRPLVVYHGTNAHAYSPDEEIKNFHTNPESGRGAAFFTSNKSLAHEYGEKVYHTYLKLKNPLVIDAQGKHWSSISHNSPIRGKATEQLNTAMKKSHDEVESIAKDMEELFGDPYTPKEFKQRTGDSLEGYKLRHIPGLEHDDLETDQVVKVAKKHGFDGVVFHNVKDSPTNDHGYRHDTADVYAVFHPQHIKSTDNSGQFGTEWHHGIKE